MSDKFFHCLNYLCKHAEVLPMEQPEQKPDGQFKTLAKVLGMGALGLGTGYLAGFGTGKLVEHITGKAGGNAADVARKIAPVAGGAAGILYPMWQSAQQAELKRREDIRHASQSARDASGGGVPGK